MIRVGILGATGYTARELLRILLRHPQVQIVAATSRQADAPHLASVHPQLAGRLDLRLENVEPVDLLDRVDCLFGCLPHAASAEALGPLLDSPIRVIDLSADFRLWDAEVYRAWYGESHPHPFAERLGAIPYGLPELYRERLRGARFVANPGCYPTSAILAMTPFLREGVIEPDLVFDSKSGVSGAGRTAKLGSLFVECNEGIAAYSVGKHRHTPEIAQILGDVAGQSLDITFTPHLTPMDRGILTTGYAKLKGNPTEAELLGIARDYYSSEPFVRVGEHLPSTKDSWGTNFCDLAVRRVGNRLVTVSCLDNLVKGAAGAAAQNFNLMFGFPETLALESL